MEKIWDLTGSLGYLIRIKLSRNKAWRFRKATLAMKRMVGLLL